MRSSPPLSLSLFNDMHIKVFIMIMIYSWVYKMRLGIYIHSPSSIFYGRHIPCMALCSCLAGGWLLVNGVYRLLGRRSWGSACPVSSRAKSAWSSSAASPSSSAVAGLVPGWLQPAAAPSLGAKILLVPHSATLGAQRLAAPSLGAKLLSVPNSATLGAQIL